MSSHGIKLKRLSSIFQEIFLTLLVVFCFTTIVLYAAGAPPFAAYYHIFIGSLGSWIKFTQVLKGWIPLTLCACGLLYTFRIGLWNIGVEGQVIMGAIFSTWVLRMGTDSQSVVTVLSLTFLAGIVGGSIWALLAGFLKTRGGVNEIFAGLGLNFVAQGILLWLIFGPWKRPGVASMAGTEMLPFKLWLPTIPGLRIAPVGMTLAVLAILVTGFLLRYSKIGLGLKAIGNNPDAAFMYRLNPVKYMLIAMIFTGGFAGMAGTIQVAGLYHRLIPAISSNYGYLALLVVMLANYNVWTAPLVAFFFACLNVGSIQLPMMLQLDSSLSGVIQGAFVLATLAVHAWRTRPAKNKRNQA